MHSFEGELNSVDYEKFKTRVLNLESLNDGDEIDIELPEFGLGRFSHSVENIDCLDRYSGKSFKSIPQFESFDIKTVDWNPSAEEASLAIQELFKKVDHFFVFQQMMLHIYLVDNMGSSQRKPITINVRGEILESEGFYFDCKEDFVIDLLKEELPEGSLKERKREGQFVTSHSNITVIEKFLLKLLSKSKHDVGLKLLFSVYEYDEQNKSSNEIEGLEESRRKVCDSQLQNLIKKKLDCKWNIEIVCSDEEALSTEAWDMENSVLFDARLKRMVGSFFNEFEQIVTVVSQRLEPDLYSVELSTKHGFDEFPSELKAFENFFKAS